jgi:hypothetical protein
MMSPYVQSGENLTFRQMTLLIYLGSSVMSVVVGTPEVRLSAIRVC